ncbi:hypothetical protein ES705_21977 [subsurface metagenome]
MWQLASELWHQLSDSEILEWERAGTRRGMTGFAWYMSQALRPNPGIYLPLAGGVMSGDIGMDGHQVKDLPGPDADQDAATKKYHDDNLPAGGYTEGARVQRTSNQSIPDNGISRISFDTENYDNDNMWEGVTNPDRMTIQTAGIYLFTGQVHWAAHAAGFRALLIQLMPAGYIAQVRTGVDPTTNEWRGPITTTWQCDVGDTLGLHVYQNSGGNLNVLYHANQSPVLSANRIG